jgi:hypothetical protein
MDITLFVKLHEAINDLMKSGEPELIRYNNINKVLIRRMYGWTYVVNATCCHPIKGGDVECGLAQRKLTPLSDDSFPALIPPQCYQPPYRELDATTES